MTFGRYELLDRLAVGGMAELFRARAPSGDPPGELAIKRLLPHLAQDSYYRDMFLDEARLTARLTHPNITRAYDYGSHEGWLYIAMELVDGLDGLSVLRECARLRVLMPTDVAVHAAREVLAALAFAHQQVDDQGEPLGVVHRDISPANVLFARSGAIKLADFGIAHAAQRQHQTRDGTLKGKYGYMSPEQVAGAPLDYRSDVFSAGILLAEMLTGRRLFAASSELDLLLMVRDVDLGRLDKYGEHIGVDLQRILRKALKKDPRERFANAGAFLEALTEWMHLHHAEVATHDVCQLIDSLYESAWAHKRERTERQVAELAMSQSALQDRQESRGESGEVEIEILAADPMPDRATQPDIAAPILPPEAAARESEPEGKAIARIAVTARSPATPGFTPVEERGGGQYQDTQELLAVEYADEPTVAPDRTARDLDAVDMPPPAMRGPLFSPSIDFDENEISALLNASDVIADVEAAGAVHVPNLGEHSGEPDETGDFARQTPISVFFRLAVARASGLLVTAVGGVCKEIHLRVGVPESVASNLVSERFGEYLVQRGVLSAGELSMALAMMDHYSGKLGETLVGLGLLQPLDVFRYLTVQLREKVIDVCTWSKGNYRWYQGRESRQPMFPLDLNAFELLGASARALPDNRLAGWFARVRDQVPYAVGEPSLPLESFGLGQATARVLDELDGVHTVAALAGAYADNDHGRDWLRVLYLLVQTGHADLLPTP